MNPAQAIDPDRAEYLKVWGIADRISGKITGILQAELDAMRQERDVRPMQLLAGVLLGLLGLLETAGNDLPPEAAILKELSTICLQGMESYRKSQRLIM